MAEFNVWQRNIADTEGNILEGAQITVTDEQGGTVELFADNEGNTPKSNPFLTGSDGLARFFAAPGFYRIQAFKSGVGQQTFIWENVGDKSVRDDTGFVGSFKTGFTITNEDQKAIWPASEGGNNNEYRWTGSLPKEVSAGSTPDDEEGWISVGDEALRSGLADSDSEIFIAGGVARYIRPYINVRDFGALGDGTDQTAEIQAALNSASSGGSVYIPPGDYTISDTLLVHSRTAFFGAGSSTRLSLADNSDCGMITNSEWGNDSSSFGNELIYVGNMHLDGNGSNQSHNGDFLGGLGQSLVTLVNVNKGWVTEIDGKSAFLHGIDTTNRNYYDPSEGPGCRDIIVDKCTLSDCGDDGVTTHNSIAVTWSNCVVRDAAATWTGNSNGFEVDDGSADTTVVNCIAINCNDGFELKGHDERVGHDGTTIPPKNTTLSNCIAIDCEIGFDIGHRGAQTFLDGAALTNCQTERCNRFARLVGAKNIVITNCTGIRDFSSTSSAVAFNQVEADGDDTCCEDCSISNCLFTGYLGINFGAITCSENSKNINIDSNIITDSGRGVWIRNGYSISVTNNKIDDFDSSGVVVGDPDSDPSEDIIIDGNTITNNVTGGFGIRVLSGFNVTLSNNIIRNVNREITTGAGPGVISVSDNDGSTRMVFIENNKVYDCKNRACVYVQAVDDTIDEVVVSGNYLSGADRYGCILFTSSRSLITGNMFEGNGVESSNSYAHIHITNNSNQNAITNNKFKGDDAIGPVRINTSDCNDNWIFGNDFLGSGFSDSVSDAGTGTVIESNRS